jgi:hypothetical protein
MDDDPSHAIRENDNCGEIERLRISPRLCRIIREISAMDANSETPKVRYNARIDEANRDSDKSKK